MKGQIEKRMREEDIEVEMPLTLEDLFTGSNNKEFVFQRLTICRGCRADPTADECKGCGRCKPEIRQIPKMQGPFMVGMKEQEVESKERCRENEIVIEQIRVPANAP